MIDIHNHMLYDVDDGSKSLEMSLDMIVKSIEQGVMTIILTPHVQSQVQKRSREDQIKRFTTLTEEVKLRDLPVILYLGAEIKYRAFKHIDYDKYKMANSNYVLIEFSIINEDPILDEVLRIKALGFIPIIAHIERYTYLTKDDYFELKEKGALFQVNTNSILGVDKRINKKIAHYLLEKELVDFISTDSHNLDSRKPNMLKTRKFLEKKYSKDYLDDLFFNNGMKIVNSTNR